MRLNIKVIVCLLYLLQNNLLIHSMPSSKEGDNRWFISGRTGTALLLKEITPDFKFLENEFRHQSGLTVDFSISNNIKNRWEPGIIFSAYRLSGQSDLPDFSAVGNHHAFINLYQSPVEYVTVSTSISGFIRYYFLNNSGKRKNSVYLQPYAEIGAGMNYFFTELGYSVPPEGISQIIFYKGTQKSGPGPGNVAQIIAGLGAKAILPGNVDLLISLNTDIVNYDCLDTVHNYTNEKRNHASSIVPKFLIGVTIPISSNDISNRHMPWSP